MASEGRNPDKQRTIAKVLGERRKQVGSPETRKKRSQEEKLKKNIRYFLQGVRSGSLNVKGDNASKNSPERPQSAD